jgi:hypothetical protein
LLESPPMRSRSPRTRWLVGAGVVLGVLITPQATWAQLTPDLTATPTRPPDNFVNWMSYGVTALGVLIALATLGAYLRYSSRFFGSPEQRGPRAGSPAPPVITVGQQARTQPQALAASMTRPPLPVHQAPVGAAAASGQAGAAPAPARASVQAPEAPPRREAPSTAEPEPASPQAEPEEPKAEEPKPEEPKAEEPKAEAPEPEEPKAEAPEPAEAKAPAPAPATGGSTLDQETYDRVLKEQLDKGVDRRVAEGKARAAGVRAARAKAEG